MTQPHTNAYAETFYNVNRARELSKLPGSPVPMDEIDALIASMELTPEEKAMNARFEQYRIDERAWRLGYRSEKPTHPYDSLEICGEIFGSDDGSESLLDEREAQWSA